MYSADENCDDYSLGSSPPCRPVIPECSDLFKAVMDDFIQDKCRYAATSSQKRAKSMFDASQTRHTKSRVVSCKRCQVLKSNCKCGAQARRRRDSLLRVQWADESCNKPLAAEYVVSDDDTDSIGRNSPIMENKDCVKSILKQKANCIIIVSES